MPFLRTWFRAYCHFIILFCTMMSMGLTANNSLAKSPEAAVRMLVWHPDSVASTPSILIPQRASESPEQALQRYFNSLHEKTYQEFGAASVGSRISQLFSKSEWRRLLMDRPEQTFQALEDLQGDHALVALTANSAQDMLQGERIRRNVKMFKDLGAQSVVIGMGADIGLEPSEQESFREQVAENFSLLVALGGDDIAPEIYNDDHKGAQQTNLQRDVFELHLIKTFKRRRKGFFFGICRGHQLGAIADGHSIRQEISQFPEAELKTHHPGTEGVHSDLNAEGPNFPQTQHFNIFTGNSLLRRFMSFAADRFSVNSIHHQAVEFNPQGNSSIVAVSETDQIVEALEQNDGHGLSVQWHPEFFVLKSLPTEFRGVMQNLMRGVLDHAHRLFKEKSLGSKGLCRNAIR